MENLIRLSCADQIHMELARLSSLSNLLINVGGVPKLAFQGFLDEAVHLLCETAPNSDVYTVVLGLVTLRFNNAELI